VAQSNSFVLRPRRARVTAWPSHCRFQTEQAPVNGFASLDHVVSALLILVLVVAILIAEGVVTVVWIRRRRTGGVLLADSSHALQQRRDQS
jgi:hypothetical protein